MTILVKIGLLGFLSSLIHLINHVSEKTNIFNVRDWNWKETNCIPTYGAWSTKENCKLVDKVSPYDSEKQCWIFNNDNNKRYKYCDIVFVEPVKIHWAITLLNCFLVFTIINSIFGGLPLLTIIFSIYMCILVPVFLYEEYLFVVKTNTKFNLYRVFYTIKHCLKIFFSEYKP